MRPVALFTAALLATQPGIASAQDNRCLTTGEFAAVTQFALPSAIQGAAVRCDGALPPRSFLQSEGPAMAARYAEASRDSWPRAKAAFLRAGGASSGKGADVALLGALPDSSLQKVLDGIIQGVVVAKLPLEHCVTVDRLFANLAPLPAANIAGVVAIVVGLVTEKKGGKLGPITICEN